MTINTIKRFSKKIITIIAHGDHRKEIEWIVCKDQSKEDFLSHKNENMKRLISDHKVSEIKICLTTLEIVLIYKTLWLKKFLLMKLSNSNQKKGDKRRHVGTEAKAAAAGIPPFSPRWGISKINLNSQSSCLI